MNIKTLFDSAIERFTHRPSALEVMRKHQDEAEGVKDVTLPRGYYGSQTYHYGRNPLDVIPRERPIIRTESRTPLRSHYPQEPLDTSRLLCESEGRTHFAKCVQENRIWELCRLLKNPKRLELLVRIYRDCPSADENGITVQDMANGASLNLSATSEYLKQLMEIGLIRRRRGGRCVGYYPDHSNASEEIGRFAAILRRRLMSGNEDVGFRAYMASLSNAFRARAIHVIATEGTMDVEKLCDLFGKSRKSLIRDLAPAVVDTVLEPDDSESPTYYRYLPVSDTVAQCLIELAG